VFQSGASSGSVLSRDEARRGISERGEVETHWNAPRWSDDLSFNMIQGMSICFND
jgi:hypothetical protein